MKLIREKMVDYYFESLQANELYLPGSFGNKRYWR